MAQKKYVCGYDFGTLSCRITVSDLATGETVFEASEDYPHGVITDALPDGGTSLDALWALQAPEDYHRVMADLTHRALG